MHFDAHLDTWDTYFGAEYTHGTPFRRAVEEGILDTEALSPRRHPRTAVRQEGSRGRPPVRIRHRHLVRRLLPGGREVVDKLRQRLGDRPVYVSIDIDVLDPAHAPGTGTPEAGGMTSRELLEILRGFRGLNLVGADVVEVSPAYDHAEITGVAASHVAYDLVSLLALRHEEAADVNARNGGDVVVETLTALGVSHVFGIPGQHALGLFDAIRRSDLTFVSSRVENNSAFGADGYARATGEVGVLFLSTGPGALTALGALQEAYATGVPLLVITSQVPRAGLGLRRGMLHQLDDQQRSAVNVTKSTAVVRGGRRDPQPAGRRVGAGPVRTGRTHLGGDPRRTCCSRPTDVPPVHDRWSTHVAAAARRAPSSSTPLQRC